MFGTTAVESWEVSFIRLFTSEVHQFNPNPKEPTYVTTQLPCLVCMQSISVSFAFSQFFTVMKVLSAQAMETRKYAAAS